MTEAAQRQRQKASRKHSIYAFSDRGAEALSTENVNSLNDLRELVKTHPGREELRRELTARVALVCYMGFSELSNDAQKGSIWESPVIKRAATWVAELRRLLDSYPDDLNVIDAESVLSAVRGEYKDE
jgi:hypothetical protein